MKQQRVKQGDRQTAVLLPRVHHRFMDDASSPAQAPMTEASPTEMPAHPMSDDPRYETTQPLRLTP
jgi:hypothetical protein